MGLDRSAQNNPVNPVNPVKAFGYRFTVKVGQPKDAEAAKNGTKAGAGEFRVPDFRNSHIRGLYQS